ncbi:MAG: hypothetical protein AAFR01_10250, partial [Pseudomonadota bacterium]
LVLIVVYAIGATVAQRTTRDKEFFPLFSWSLFTAVRDPLWITVLEVHQIGEQSFDPPIPFFELPEYFAAARNQDINAWKLSGQIATRIFHEKKPADDLMGYMEQRYLNIGRTVGWQVSAYRVDTLDYYHDRTIRERLELSPRRTFGAVE